MNSGAVCPLSSAFAWSSCKGATGNSDFDGKYLVSLIRLVFVYTMLNCKTSLPKIDFGKWKSALSSCLTSDIRAIGYGLDDFTLKDKNLFSPILRSVSI